MRYHKEQIFVPSFGTSSAACMSDVSDVLYLTSFALILFGFDQLAPSLAHVVAGLIHAVLNAVHHFALPYRHVENGKRGLGTKTGRDDLEVGPDHPGEQQSRERMHPGLHIYVHIMGK